MFHHHGPHAIVFLGTVALFALAMLVTLFLSQDD